MTMRRAGFLATKLRSGKVLITGATRVVIVELPPYPDEPYSTGTELYDPATGTFSVGPETFTEGSPQFAVEVPDGRVLMLRNSCGLCDPLAGLLDPSAGTFTKIKGPTIRLRHAIATSTGRVIVSDGTSVQRFDSSTATFTPAGTLSGIPVNASIVPLSTGRVLLMGGWDPPTSTPLATAFLYDPETGSVTPTGSLTRSRNNLAGVVLRDGRVLAVGGAEDSAIGQMPSYPPPEVYDPSTGTFSAVVDVGVELDYRVPYVAALANGDALLLGGSVDAGVFVHSSASLRATATMNASHVAGAVVPLDDGSALAVGGIDSMYNSIDTAELFIPACSAGAP